MISFQDWVGCCQEGIIITFLKLKFNIYKHKLTKDSKKKSIKIINRIWDELEENWPVAYWDDWLRNNLRRKDRQIIRPEICRSKTFGEKGGASSGQFYKNHLSTILLNGEGFVD